MMKTKYIYRYKIHSKVYNGFKTKNKGGNTR